MSIELTLARAEFGMKAVTEDKITHALSLPIKFIKSIFSSIRNFCSHVDCSTISKPVEPITELALPNRVEGVPVSKRHNQLALQKMIIAAVSEKDVIAVKSLIRKGARVDNLGSEDTQYLIYLAFESKDPSFIKLLLEKGLNIEAPDENGSTMFYDNCEIRYLELAEWLLDNGANIDAVSSIYGGTRLHKAARNEEVEIVEFLLGHKATTDLTDNNGKTPIDLAREGDNMAVLALLQDHMKTAP